MTIEEELKTALANRTLVIGTRETVRLLKEGGAKEAVLASNAPGSVSRDAKHYAGISKVPVQTFKGTAAQLGTFLGKPFGVSACAIKAETKK